MAEVKKQEQTEKDIETRIYEIGYLLVPTLADEEVSGIVASLKDIVREAGGILLGEGEPKTKNLAYSMTKAIGHNKKDYDSAYFGWLSFELSIGNIEKVTTAIEDNESVIRMLVVKTTREEAIPKKKSSVVRKKRIAKKEEISGKPASSAEIDKAIEEMVIDEKV